MKVTPNMAEVVVHACLPNCHQNLGSNFSSEKLVKSKTLLCSFAKVRLTHGDNS